MSEYQIDNRFKQAMVSAALMGVLTNVYIATIFLFVDIYEALFSPVIGFIIFLVCFFLLKKDKIDAEKSFLSVAYIVIVEVFVHTYFLGWESGFYYFMFLLPIVFLLNANWKLFTIVLFNSSVLIATIVLWWWFKDGESFISEDISSYINIINMAGTGLIVFVIMIYYKRTVLEKDVALISANRELKRKNKKIVGQHQNLEILLKEVHHRVKNNLQIISSLMSLQKDTIENKEAIVVLSDSKRRVEAIALIHQKLYQDEKFNSVDFKSYIEEILSSQQIMNATLKCIIESPEVVLSLDTSVPLGLIISEMIANSVKHAFKGVDSPELKVVLTEVDRGYELLIKDNGVGLPDGFDINNPSSLGTEIISALTMQIGATVECFNDNGAGFKISFQNI
ncbi:MAG: hypothetical protein COB15_00530 [Flavobacteriales bacterium]|nr:MAG: hypothetical protein COB15_00530 [Flavobacteriales bacterium]